MNATPNIDSSKLINSAAQSEKRNVMSDLRHHDNQNGLIAAVMDDIQVTVTWSHGGFSRFHHGWLRENCPSTESRHPSSMERLIQPSEISPNIKPEQGELSEDGFLVVTWPLSEGRKERHRSSTRLLPGDIRTQEPTSSSFSKLSMTKSSLSTL
ncbi:hypothetical protein KMS_R35520 [Pseudomonas sp. LRP2-20]|uniref:gamma-butyrobetaine hydroxylase-like domain-containing protein n=1 Tax=Pseudomonas sp. LRP2-20 TaxID=2944234 RepID=UPI002186F603|nr:gamma-butyrobetaine hydroxylase-like domain-containing protein [Pseudomonas sp. LRP2-20]BDM23796.1 hypothetical protein KMS_R35520 [Pseudomonas sp. LRP2-20]